MQRLTRFGESGVWGFINHLDSREVGQLLAQSIATEAYVACQAFLRAYSNEIQSSADDLPSNERFEYVQI